MSTLFEIALEVQAVQARVDKAHSDAERVNVHRKITRINVRVAQGRGRA